MNLRVAVVGAAIVGGFACGGSDQPARPPAPRHEAVSTDEYNSGTATISVPSTLEATRRCLERQGLEVIGGAEGDASDGPDVGELITAGAFLAFYSSDELAERRASAVRNRARKLHARVARYGAITALYLNASRRPAIERCVD